MNILSQEYVQRYPTSVLNIIDSISTFLLGEFYRAMRLFCLSHRPSTVTNKKPIERPFPLIHLLSTTTRMPFEILFVMLIGAVFLSIRLENSIFA